jgi:hypothetical protein
MGQTMVLPPFSSSTLLFSILIFLLNLFTSFDFLEEAFYFVLDRSMAQKELVFIGFIHRKITSNN